jgi:hypothetical protein
MKTILLLLCNRPHDRSAAIIVRHITQAIDRMCAGNNADFWQSDAKFWEMSYIRTYCAISILHEVSQMEISLGCNKSITDFVLLLSNRMIFGV